MEASMLQLWFFSNSVLWPLNTQIGGSTLNLSTVILVLVGAIWLGMRGRITLSSAKVLLALLVYVIFSFTLVLTGPCRDQLQKSVITTPILLFLVLIGFEVGRRASASAWSDLQKTAQAALLVAFAAFIVEILIPAWFPFQARYRAKGQLSGLFGEPSHVAFSLFPCVAVLLVAENKRTRQKGMLALLGLAAFSRSSTLIAFIAAWALYRLVAGKTRHRQTVLLALGALSLIAVGAAIDFDRLVAPTVERIVGIATAPSETVNLSSLVYVQGWQDAWFNLQRTHGLGLGINMMGCGALPDVSARSAIALTGLELNSFDGSFLFAKVVSETGVAGIAFYVAVIWWWVRLEKKLRHLRPDTARFAAATQAALIFCFVASSFIRSGIYFDSSLLLWVVAAGGASKLRNLSPQLAGSPFVAAQKG
jgi:hypothetical protein